VIKKSWPDLLAVFKKNRTPEDRRQAELAAYPAKRRRSMSEKTKFNILLTHLITFFVSIPALMIIGYFFPGEVAPNEASWAVWATIGVGIAHVVSLFIFFCVLLRQDKKKRKQDNDE
jgi:uncharacterized membrane protein